MPITQNGVLKRDDNDVPVMGGTSSTDNATIINASLDPTTRRLLVSDVVSLVELVATGAVNGVNTSFTFISLPTYIVSDGVWYKQLDANSNVQWSWVGGTLTATMTVPPTFSIYGF